LLTWLVEVAGFGLFGGLVCLGYSMTCTNNTPVTTVIAFSASEDLSFVYSNTRTTVGDPTKSGTELHTYRD
jgi:hypothetical protein